MEEAVTESVRMLDGSKEPHARDVAAWVGQRNYARWSDLTRYIEATYPDVFNVDWLFGGQKHGWSLRYKKSKSFCTLIPERGRFKVLLVFGGAEQAKVVDVLASLASHVREDYEKSTTYHDGRWVLVTVDSMKVISDVKRLLAVKRAPRVAR